MNKRLFILFNISVLCVTSLRAQYQKPPDVTIKTISYELPELIIRDSAFMDRFDFLIFNAAPNIIREGIDTYLRISIKRNKEIFVELSDVCGDVIYEGVGYFERNGLTYIVMGNNLNNIFTVSECIKCFTYKATMWGDADITEDDLPLWILRYKNRKLKLCYSP